MLKATRIALFASVAAVTDAASRLQGAGCTWVGATCTTAEECCTSKCDGGKCAADLIMEAEMEKKKLFDLFGYLKADNCSKINQPCTTVSDCCGSKHECTGGTCQ